MNIKIIIIGLLLVLVLFILSSLTKNSYINKVQTEYKSNELNIGNATSLSELKRRQGYSVDGIITVGSGGTGDTGGRGAGASGSVIILHKFGETEEKNE